MGFSTMKRLFKPFTWLQGTASTYVNTTGTTPVISAAVSLVTNGAEGAIIQFTANMVGTTSAMTVGILGSIDGVNYDTLPAQTVSIPASVAVKRVSLKTDFPYFKTYVVNASATDANTFKTSYVPLSHKH